MHNLFETPANAVEPVKNVIFFVRVSDEQVKLIQVADEGVYIDRVAMAISRDFVLPKAEFQKINKLMPAPIITINNNTVSFTENKRVITMGILADYEVPKIDDTTAGLQLLPANFISVFNVASRFADDDLAGRYNYVYIKGQKIMATDTFQAYGHDFADPLLPDLGNKQLALSKKTFRIFSKPTMFKIVENHFYLANDDGTKMAILRTGQMPMPDIAGLFNRFDESPTTVEFNHSELLRNVSDICKLDHRTMQLSANKIESQSDVFNFSNSLHLPIDFTVFFNPHLFKNAMLKGRMLFSAVMNNTVVFRGPNSAAMLMPLRVATDDQD